MISSLYEPFRHWSDGGSVYFLSDTHFGDFDCKLIDDGALSAIETIHRLCINQATERKHERERAKGIERKV